MKIAKRVKQRTSRIWNKIPYLLRRAQYYSFPLGYDLVGYEDTLLPGGSGWIRLLKYKGDTNEKEKQP